MTDKTKMILIAFLVHSWWIVPISYTLVKAVLGGLRARVEDARNQKEPTFFFLTNLGRDGADLITTIFWWTVKLLLILIALVVVVKVGGWLFGPTYGPEYEAWKY